MEKYFKLWSDTFEQTLNSELSAIHDRIPIIKVDELEALFEVDAPIQCSAEYLTKLINQLQRDEHYTNLIQTINSLSILKAILYIYEESEVDVVDIKQIDRLIKDNPQSNFHVLSWFIFNTFRFSICEKLESEIVKFYTDIFQKCSHIIENDNFNDEWGHLMYNPNLRDISKSVRMIPVYQEATKLYPKKLSFKQYLASLYLTNAKYTEALQAYSTLIAQAEQAVLSIDFDYSDLIHAKAHKALSLLHLKDYASALKEVDNIIGNEANRSISPQSSNNDDLNVNADPYTYCLIFFIRMHVNFKNDQYDKVIEDYKRIEQEKYTWTDAGYDHTFHNVLSYIEERKREEKRTLKNKQQ